MCHVTHSGEAFHARLRYVRWLWHLHHGEPTTNEAIATAAKHTGQWLTGLIAGSRFPAKALDQKALARYFGVSEDWLFDDESEEAPPEPKLWAVWEKARSQDMIPEAAFPPVETQRSAKKKPAKRA